MLSCKSLRLVGCVGVLALGAACAHPQVPTLPGSERETNRPRTVIVAVDHLGDLYPNDPHLDEDLLVRRHTASIWNYYRFRGSRLQSRNRATAVRWASVAARYGVAVDPHSTPIYAIDTRAGEWAAVQDRVFSRTRDEILRVTGGGRLPLVVMVHGFNTGDPGPGYDSLRSVIIEQVFAGARSDSVAFLELHWDGSSGPSLRVLDAWWKGQGNAFPVGLALRRVLNTLPETMPVRIVTHSLGGTVTSVALWNVDRTITIDRMEAITACSDVRRGPRTDQVSLSRFSVADEWYCLYRDRQQDTALYRTPRFRDLRVGMIVPAMPVETFMDDSAQTPMNNPGVVQRIVVGINPLDYAVTRGAWKVGFGCRDRAGLINVGGTCAAVDSGAIDRALLSRCRTTDRTVAHLVHFTDWPTTPKVGGRQNHALTVYARRPAMPKFLSLVFDPSLVPVPVSGCVPYRGNVVD
jgi:hypothetical protein